MAQICFKTFDHQISFFFLQTLQGTGTGSGLLLLLLLLLGMCGVTKNKQEATNSAYELSLREGMHFEKRLFQSTFATHDRKDSSLVLSRALILIFKNIFDSYDF